MLKHGLERLRTRSTVAMYKKNPITKRGVRPALSNCFTATTLNTELKRITSTWSGHLVELPLRLPPCSSRLRNACRPRVSLQANARHAPNPRLGAHQRPRREREASAGGAGRLRVEMCESGSLSRHRLFPMPSWRPSPVPPTCPGALPPRGRVFRRCDDRHGALPPHVQGL
jgi:hypothetical protein